MLVHCCSQIIPQIILKIPKLYNLGENLGKFVIIWEILRKSKWFRE